MVTLKDIIIRLTYCKTASFSWNDLADSTVQPFKLSVCEL